ncbi:collagen-like triple helix repeat-containing protein [Marinigracilibium pacificum]|uniref:Collagen-like protein n=1 Tax=Marinigracilibium pacificum TaxID=2729599 RepID=A0A848IXE7_9BACT|nr:collagen-like protein [Marinigracilibium pacificum]NMM47981.1 collagen-like protein [Marinigracilibium pacificum]
MKPYIKLLIPILFIVLGACEGPRGPAGPQGPQGQDGGLVYAQGFETQEVNFTSSNNYANSFTIPQSIDIIDTDIIVTYILWEVFEGNDVWRPLPQTVYNTTPSFTYNFDYTFEDVIIFLDAAPNADLSLLPTGFTQNQIFRVIVIPADFGARLDLTNYEEVTKALNITDENIIKLK